MFKPSTKIRSLPKMSIVLKQTVDVIGTNGD